MDAQWLIGEVARRHGLLLDKDDPVLVTVTLNEIVLAEYVGQVKVALEQAQVQAAAACSQDLLAAQKAAQTLLVRAGGHLSEQVRAAGIAVKAELGGVLKAQLEAVGKDVATTQRLRRSSLWCALVAAAGAALAMGGGLVHCAR